MLTKEAGRRVVRAGRSTAGSDGDASRLAALGKLSGHLERLLLGQGAEAMAIAAPRKIQAR